MEKVRLETAELMAKFKAPSNIPGLTNKDVHDGTVGLGPHGHSIHDRDDERLLDPTLQARVAYWLAPKAFSLKEIKEECKIRKISRDGNKKVLALKLAFQMVPENVNMLNGLLSAPPKTVDDGGAKATTKGKEVKKQPIKKKTVAKKKAATSKSTPSVAIAVTPTTAEEDPDWKYIDTVDTLVFLFKENQGSHIPYTLEVIWVVEDKEYFIQQSFNSFNGRCAEQFIPLIQDTAKKATKLKDFMVRYNNGRDRTWPYTRVSDIAQVVASVKNCEAALDSIDSGYREFIVNLNEVGEHDGGKIGDVKSFVGKVDLTQMTHPLERYMMLDYIGNGAVEKLLKPAEIVGKKSAGKKKANAKS